MRGQPVLTAAVRHARGRAAALGLVLALAARSPSAAQLYVDPAGADAPACLAAAPCLTVAHAISLAADGDVIQVADGVYVENLDVPRGLDITIQGQSSARTILDGGGAGPVIAFSGGRQTLSDLTIRNGRNDNPGGGIIADAGNVTVRRCLVAGNSTDIIGGGIFVYGARVTVQECRLAANTALLGGGAIYNRVGVLDISDSTIAFNSSTSGGGIFTIAPTTILNTTISSNVAFTDGGGLWVGGNGETTARNVTITNNSARGDAAGGLQGFAVVHLYNSIIAGNSSAGTTPDCQTVATTEVDSDGYNVIGDATGCDMTGDTASNVTGVPARLGPLTDNGGTSPTHALLRGSPAIDAGDPLGCLDIDDVPLLVDQRGQPRPVDCSGATARCDIGAYEGCPPPIVVDFSLFESLDPATVDDPGNLVATSPTSPFDHAAPTSPDPSALHVLYYVVHDPAGVTVTIDSVILGGAGILVSF